MKTNQKQPMKSIFTTGIQVPVLFALFALLPTGLMAQWNSNTYVNLLVSSYSGDVLLSAPTTDGKTWVAFYSLNAGNYAMRAQLLDANGFKLLGPDGIVVSNYTSGSATYVFNICLDATNNLIIAMQDQRTGSMRTVLYKISQAGIHLWDPAGVVLGAGLAPNPAVLSTGETVVCWDESVSGTLNLQKISTGGTTVWSTPIQVKVGTTKTTRGQIVGNSGGTFTMVYQKKGVGISTSLYAQRFDNSGTALYTALQISNQTSSGARYYSILADADTTYFGFYVSQGSRFNSFLQRINPGGTIPWGMNGSNFNTSVGSSDNYQMTTDINMTPGSNYIWSVSNFCNTLQSQYGIYVQKFLKTTGARQFGDGAKVVYPISATRDQHADRIAMVNDAPMFMGYSDVDYKIYALRLDANGNFVWPGNKVEISSTTASAGTPKMRYGFTPDGPNRCAGIWTENRGTGYLGYAQGISIGGLLGVKVKTQGNIPATITVNGGTLQVVDTILPLTSNQNVTWSLVPANGIATISAGGLVSALADGIVYAKAVALQDNTVTDSLMITISGQVPTVTTLAATNTTQTAATLNGSVTAKNYTTNVYFYYGLTTAYTNIVPGIPSIVSGTTPTGVYVNLTGLTPNNIYHYRCEVVCSAGTFTGADMTFATCSTPGTPGPINGPPTVCQSQTGVNYSVAPIPNALGYTWTVPPGASIVSGTGTPSIIVNFSGTAASGNVTVTGTSVCASGPTGTLGVSVMPIPVPTIQGATNLCVNSAQIEYFTQTGMGNYQWSIAPGGTITAGAGTYDILVTWTDPGSKWVSVNYTNAGGCAAASPTTLNVTVNPIPDPAGQISGSTAICVGTQNVPYQVSPIPNTIVYIWTLPANATIASGSGTNSITVDFAANASSGNITVNGNNTCGNGAASNLNVILNPIPPTPVIMVSGHELISSSASGNQWFHNGTAVQGANAQTYHVPLSAPGWYWTVVTLNNCASDTSNNEYIAGVGIGEKNDAGIAIYPVPNTGNFSISISSVSDITYKLDVYNNLGVKIYGDKSISVNGTKVTPVDLGPVPNGLYTIILRTNDNQVVRKILVNK
ncbi:MAG: T9SS type A sorting domain-containing protein [Bacteroidetes bacterium]|nr:T9SS type A sorting domain-containing protein [Bacteroidota bacterium]